MITFNECLFTDLLYGKQSVNLAGTTYEVIFIKNELNPEVVELKDLVYVAQEIADNMSITDGVAFMQFIIVLCSQALNK